MKKILFFIAALILIATYQLFSNVHTIYDAQLKIEQTKVSILSTKDAILNSPIYGMIFYAGSAIIIFVIAIVLVFVIIMSLRR